MNGIRDNPGLTRKDRAIAFLTLVAEGDVRNAYAQYAAPDFRHHNPYYKGDAASLMHGMEDHAAEFPAMTIDVMRALEDGDLVAVHSRVRLTPEGPNVALVHIFRFRGDAIVELWDVTQPVPENCPNKNGMF